MLWVGKGGKKGWELIRGEEGISESVGDKDGRIVLLDVLDDIDSRGFLVSSTKENYSFESFCCDYERKIVSN